MIHLFLEDKCDIKKSIYMLDCEGLKKLKYKGELIKYKGVGAGCFVMLDLTTRRYSKVDLM